MSNQSSKSSKSKTTKPDIKPDRQKGLDYYHSMLTLAQHEGDRHRITIFKAIIKRLESLHDNEKKK